MTSKDKPKRGGAKHFDRETKPRDPAKASAGKKGFSAKAGLGPRKPRAEDAAAERPAGKRPARPTDAKSAAERPARKPAAVPPGSRAAVTEAEGKPERISKIMARAGVASRRDVERMIMEGRVRLNGALLDTPVVNATMADRIEVDGVPIRGIERTRLWLYHKPSGLVTTNSDPEGRPTVFDNLPEGLPRVLSIGRLDINTEGLLLLTNDGGLSRVLELPTTGWLRRYRVRAHGDVDQAALDKLKEGIAVDGVLYGAIDATLDRQQGHNVWITVGLREGKNREVKNVLGALGLEVNRLIRISYGPFQLGDLPEGHAVEVRGRMLRDQLGPRLIEEAKANFDAPIYNEPAAGEETRDGPVREERPETPQKSDWTRGARPDDRRDRERGKGRDRTSDKGHGRVDTKRGERMFSGKPAGGRDERDFKEDRPKKRPPMGTSRTTNVWMAPGARPTTEAKAKRFSARADAERLFDKPKPQNDRPVVVNRADDDSDWIRAESPPPGSDERGGGFERKRSFGDRSDRGERPARGDRPFGGKPRGDRRPREDGERPRSARPGGDKPFGGKPGGGKSFGGKPSSGRGKPGGKPGGGRPGGRPGGKPRTPRG